MLSWSSDEILANLSLKTSLRERQRERERERGGGDRETERQREIMIHNVIMIPQLKTQLKRI